jgi:tRNA 2-selenouridine synthase
MTTAFDTNPASPSVREPLVEVRAKYPEILSFSRVFPQLSKFDALIDVRSPAEFAQDHLPGAINCPVLNDLEREHVGTVYKQINTFEAKKIGAAIVARNIGSHIETLFIDKPREWRPLVYCWRGGNRSGAMAHVLARIGWHAAQLDGGYKAYRHHVNETMQSLPTHFRFKVICGTTGSGKSRLLQHLHAGGAQVIDLEDLAVHRGSVLGHLPETPQPSQKMFESHLWAVMLSLDPEREVFIESESKKVGNLRVPDALMAAMRASPCVALELPVNERVALLMTDYAHFVEDPEALNRQLNCLTSLYGKEKISDWHAMSSSGNIAEVVKALLSEHYDPAYRRSIAKNFSQFAAAATVFMENFSEKSFVNAAEAIGQSIRK